ncbi:MAG: SUMF1/EgtB/PvdO family nonheme iron enzyme [Deltaproteobacteria bacterium]|nr:SUMF1/EgtB/PvdO family nonheme iron enzyme [Deltaproteobacteria bacterium]
MGERAWIVGACGIFVGAAALFGVFVWATRSMLAQGERTAEQDGLRGPPQLGHTWRLVRGRHWQIVSADYEDPEATDGRERTRGACPVGMVDVKGEMKVEPSDNPYSGNTIDDLQRKTCTDWISRDYPERCRTFDREAWLKLSEELATRSMHFCIDRFEYPNRRGQYPMIYASWCEAREECQGQGKRLCTEDEWTFACEGEEAMPYPYGYEREPDKCPVDRSWRPYNQKAMVPRDGDAARYEMDRLWQGVASGARPGCRSPFGVYDLTGNVDEWTVSARPGERPSILKGGYWGPVRTRCRPSTRSHDENHTFYQQGFRCCADVGAKIRRAEASDPMAAPLPQALP